MKNISFQILILFFLLVSISSAIEIDTVFVQLDSLGNRLQINSAWHFHSGDDSTWALLDYNSSEWDTLESWFDNDERKWNGIGWFRKTIVIDSASRNKSIALRMYHYGASEIYWNGNLIHEFGEVGADTSTEKNLQPLNIPIVLQLDTNLVYTLAIRYSNQRSIVEKRWMNQWFQGVGFIVALSDINTSFKNLIYGSRIGAGINFGIAGLFLSLAILYFFLFIFYAHRVENLYYSLFTFLLGVIFADIYIINSFFFGLNYVIVLKILNLFSILLTFNFYILSSISLFYFLQ